MFKEKIFGKYVGLLGRLRLRLDTASWFVGASIGFESGLTKAFHLQIMLPCFELWWCKEF
jgi:hypothetical protein